MTKEDKSYLELMQIYLKQLDNNIETLKNDISHLYKQSDLFFKGAEISEARLEIEVAQKKEAIDKIAAYRKKIK